MEYEICYLIGESKEANLDKIRKDVEEVISKHQGVLIDGEFVKKRRLSYEIKKEARGTYVAKRFSLPSKDEIDEKYPEKDFIGEITSDLNFSQDVLRFMIVKAEEIPDLKDLEVAGEDKDLEKEGDSIHSKDTRVKDEKVKEDKDVSKESQVLPNAEEKDVTKEEVVLEEEKVVAKEDKVALEEDKKESEVEKEDVQVAEDESVEAEGESKVASLGTEEDSKEEAPKKKKKKKEKKEKDEISEENIDEKLDEILNI
jgi:ribosomal protein S6